MKEEETTDLNQCPDNARGLHNSTSTVEISAEGMTQATPSAAEGRGDIVIRVLDRDLHVSDDFYRALVGRAQDCIPRLKFEEVFKAQHVIGPDYWRILDNPHRWVAGKVLAHLVVTGRLPLRFASCPLCTIKYYERC